VAARFAAYALIIVVAGGHLIGRASGDEKPRPSWVTGRTSQGAAAGMKLDDLRVVVVGMRWSAACTDSQTYAQHSSFSDSPDTDWRHRGKTFSASFQRMYTDPAGETHTVTGELNGVSRGRGAHGTVSFEADWDGGDREVNCSTGALSWRAGG
jgi:hypothetical protein